MNLLEKGSRWLEQMRNDHCSSPVEYRRGETSATVSATSGKTDFELADEYGGKIGSHVIDFLIMADELNLKPEVGDLIVANGQKYEVMNLGGEGCWRWSDPNLITLRIHTKEVGPA